MKNNMPKIKRKKYYAILSKNDNYLHGVFPLSKEGYQEAKTYIQKISSKNYKNFYIQEK
jgi:hypothetical protein